MATGSEEAQRWRMGAHIQWGGPNGAAGKPPQSKVILVVAQSTRVFRIEYMPRYPTRSLFSIEIETTQRRSAVVIGG